MKTINERENAVKILIDIFKNDSYSNIALRNFFNGQKDLNKQQKSFITEVVNGTLRNLIYLDFVINTYSKTKTKKMKPVILNVLRISVYQIYFMDRVPEHAICNSAVDIVKKYKLHGLTGFVNGVLRTIIKNKNVDLLKDLDKITYLSVKYSYDKWIIQYWLSEHTYEEVEEMCIANNERKKVSICVNTIKTNVSDITNSLQNDGVQVEKSFMCDNSLKISKSNDITKLEAFEKGLFHVMGESSQIAIDVLNPKQNSKLLDLCAAPGGKSFYASYKMNNTGEILSCDIHEHKIKLLDETVERLQIKNIKTKLNDATKLNEEFVNKFDYVLLDAPCSGLGIVGKRPEIKYSKTFEDIEALSSLQKEILQNAIKYLKEGGELVYSTCAISKRENINNVKWVLQNSDLELVNLQQHKFGLESGVIEILPTTENGMDGFFIAKFRRKDNE